MPAIITSKTRAIYERPPSGRVVVNLGCLQAQGLYSFWSAQEENRETALDLMGRFSIAYAENVPSRDAGPGGWAFGSLGTSNASYLSSATITTAVPFTVSAWFNSTSFASASTLFSVGVSSDRFTLGINTAGTIFATARQANSSATATTTAASTTGEWWHGAAVFDSATQRAAWLNGGDKTSNTTSKTPDAGSMADTGIARLGAGTSFLKGRMAHVCFWNRALSDAEMYRLWDPPTRWELYYQPGLVVYPRPAAAAATGYHNKLQGQKMQSKKLLGRVA